MGIRYYASPVRATDLELARQDPLAYMNDNPILAPDHDWEDPLFLFLDKSWRHLQELFVWPNTSPAEQGLDLVRGDVTYPSGYADGYLCHYQVLDPDKVAEIARQISRVDSADVVALLLARSPVGSVPDRLREDVSYVSYFLRRAQVFTAACAEAGHGAVYRIG